MSELTTYSLDHGIATITLDDGRVNAPSTAMLTHRIGLNEVCLVTGSLLEPAQARDAGFLDELAPAEALHARAHEVAQTLTKVDRTAHAATKLRIREEAIAGVRDDIERLPPGDAAQF